MDEQHKKKEEPVRVSKINEMLLESPNDCFLHHALGLELVKHERMPEAIISFRKVLDLDKNYLGTYYHLAHALWRESPAEAKEVFISGLEIAKELKDQHSQNELQMAFDEYNDEMDQK